MSLLEVKNLHTYFKTKKGIVKAVNDVTYSLDAGKTLGIVGESGSGKSVSAMSIIKLLDGNGYIESGEITFDGKDIRNCTEKEMYHIRGNEISVIFQEPMTSLNPVFTVERQIGETLQIHQNMSKKEARAKAVGLLADVKIPNPERVAKQYPFQLSGGMRQRVMIAMALACKPKLLIADEPTTALDVTIQAQILEADERPEAGDGHLYPVHHPRPGRHPRDGRRGGRDVLWADCGKGSGPYHLPRRHLFPSLHRGADDFHPPAEHPQGREAGRHPRLGAQPAVSAPGLQVCPPVQILHPKVPGGGAHPSRGGARPCGTLLLSGKGGEKRTWRMRTRS